MSAPWIRINHSTQKDTYYYQLPKSEAALTKSIDGNWYLACLPLGIRNKHVGSGGMLEEELFSRALKILRKQFELVQSLMAQFE